MSDLRKDLWWLVPLGIPLVLAQLGFIDSSIAGAIVAVEIVGFVAYHTLRSRRDMAMQGRELAEARQRREQPDAVDVLVSTGMTRDEAVATVERYRDG